MNTDDYEISGTLAFSNDELKKELHQIALNGLQAFVDAYETAYLGSTTLDNGIKISVEDNTRLPYATLGDSVTDAKDFYDLTVAMYDSYEAAKSLCELETQQNINAVDLVSGITTSVSKVKKIADDMGDTLGFTSPKAGIISSVIGFAGAAIATFDGTTQDEKDALVQSSIDFVGEGLKLGLKAIPGVGLLGSVGIDVGVDLAVILATNIYEISQGNKNSEDIQIMNDYIAKLNESNLNLKKSLARERLWIGTPDGEGHEFYDKEYKVLALGGNDNIRALADNMIIYLGTGDDHISNYRADIEYYKDYGRHFTKLWGSIGEPITIYGGAGKDTIDNLGIGCIIYAGSDNDSIRNRHKNAYIDGENGDDYIENGTLDCMRNGSRSYISGLNSTIFGGNGNDTIDNSGGGVFINGGNDNDSINNHGGTSIILGENGNDYIYSYESSSTIVPGKGEDLIELEARTYAEYGRLIQYTSDDGNDTIIGISKSDSIQISGSEYKTIANGNDVIIKVGDGSILLKGSANTAVNIEGTLTADTSSRVETETNIANTDFTIDGGADNDYIHNTDSDLTISGGDGTTTTIYDYTGGDKIIKNYSSEEKVKLSSDFACIDISGNNFVIKSGSGSLTLENVRDKVIDVAGTDGNTAAYVYMFSGEGFIDGTIADKYEVIVGSENAMNHLKAGNFGSSLIGGGGYTTLTSGAGDDFMQGGSGKDTFVYTGGNDVIYNYQSSEQINFAATYTGWTTDGNNLVITAAEGSVRIKETQNKLIEVGDADGNLLAHVYQADSYEGIIDGRGFGAFEIIIGSDSFSNQIYADAAGSSLWGGRGNSNDELYGNTGADVFIYAYNNGQDNVFNAGLEDSVDLLNISLDQIASAQITDNGVTVQFTDGGSLNINGQAGSFKLGGQTFYADYHNKSWS